MGAGWRRITESFKQSTLGNAVGGKFVATSPDRVNTMLKEAADFAANLKRIDKEIRSFKRSTESLLAVTRSVLGAALPHTYEETAAGGGAAANALETIGGPLFRADEVARVGGDLGQQLETEVLTPLQRWLAAYETAVGKSREVEQTRLEVDSRRRTVQELARQVDEARGRLGGSNADKAQAQLEGLEQKLQHKQEKLNVALEGYVQEEAQLSKSLAALIKDAAWLRNFVAAAMALHGRALLDASALAGASQQADGVATVRPFLPAAAASSQWEPPKADGRPASPGTPGLV